MADIRPFCCIHPAKGKEREIAALPYDVYSRAEARRAVEGKPLSFLNIDRPETQFPEGYDMYAPEVYARAGDRFREMLQSGAFVKEAREAYYLYELSMDGHSQRGLVACAAIDDYLNGVIRKHENTREEKEIDRIRHVEALNAQTGPILLAYRAQAEIQQIVTETIAEEPEFSFFSEDGVRHRGWKISDPEKVQEIREAFQRVGRIYIADGHHRAASAVKVGLKRRAERPDDKGNGEWNAFLCVLFPDNELKILEYNRVVRDLNGLTEEDFLKKVQEKFFVSPLPSARKPKAKGEITLYLHGRWFSLLCRPEYIKKEQAEALDTAYLQRELLAPVLGITDPRRDERIDFVGGICGLPELQRRADSDMEAAFALYPTSIGELFAVSDAGQLMPPKSTWFEPKLRSGLFIHGLE